MKRILHGIWRVIRTVIIIVVVFMGLRFIVLSSITDRPVCPFCFHPHLIHDYYFLTGIDRRCAVDDPSVTVRIYGEPLSTNEKYVGADIYCVYYNYDGFSILFYTEDKENYEYGGFILYSEKRWVRWDIHVGSSREQIINAYRKCCYDLEEGELGTAYLDTGKRNEWVNWVRFTYDENDIVTSIRYIP